MQTHLTQTHPTQTHPIPASPAYQAIVAVADTDPAYRYQDIEQWDRAVLADNPERFLWILGRHGTNLIRYDTQGSCEIASYRAQESGNRFFVCEQGRLQEVDSAEALAFVQTLPLFFKVTPSVAGWATAHAQSSQGKATTFYLPPEVGTLLLERQNEAEQAAHSSEVWDSRPVHAFQRDLRAALGRLKPAEQ